MRRSDGGWRLRGRSSGVHPARQDAFDTMDLRGDVRRRQTCHLPNRRGIELFEIEQHDLSILCNELLNEVGELRTSAFGIESLVDARSKCVLGTYRPAYIECVQWYLSARTAVVADGVRCRNVMSDAIHPGSQRTPAIERRKAAPEGEVNLLQEVLAPVGVALVTDGESFER